jgi:hypothetical protein
MYASYTKSRKIVCKKITASHHLSMFDRSYQYTRVHYYWRHVSQETGLCTHVGIGTWRGNLAHACEQCEIGLQKHIKREVSVRYVQSSVFIVDPLRTLAATTVLDL